MMEETESYGEFIIASDYLKEKLFPLSECQLKAISARIADSIREIETKIRAEFEKDQNK